MISNKWFYHIKFNMVHKKSEYRLQFHNLSNDIRAQIWRDNYMFRETQKRMNISDHYWQYQLIDDGCDCESESDLGVTYENPAGLLSNQSDLLTPEMAGMQPSLVRDKEVQTPNWKMIKNEQEYSSSNTLERQLIGTVDQRSPAIVGQESPMHKQSQSTERTVENCVKHKSTSDYIDTNHQNSVLRGSQNPEQHQSRFLKNTVFSEAVNSPASKLIYSNLNRTPTRNVQKSYPPGKKLTPVFASFGWNDSDKNIGDQKTYNVRAPFNQVHHTALLASGKRLKDLELIWADQLKKKRQQQSLLSIGPVNLSSMWMTEYQESYSKGKREPLPRTTSHRPIVWRYT